MRCLAVPACHHPAIINAQFCVPHPGLYEMSHYAFLADRTGGSGLSWEQLHDPGNAMLHIWTVFAVEWVLLMGVSFWIEQVL
jgi:hypothetical protein